MKNLIQTFFKFLSDTQQGICYTRVTSNQDCAEPLTMKLSKKDCCCGKDMGKGWGNTCEHCPFQGMGKYIYLYLLTRLRKHQIHYFILIYFNELMGVSIVCTRI